MTTSTFTLKDWTVYALSGETAPASFDAASNTLTLSPSLTDTAPIVYQFYDNHFDIGKTTAEVQNDLRFDMKLNLANDGRSAFSDFIVDAVTMPPVNIVGNDGHPTLAHFHPSAITTPGSLTQSNAYRLEMESSYATTKPNLHGATRAHLFGDLVEPGETANWTAAKVHHWDGVFSLVITPITSATYYAPYGDAGNRLQGLSTTNPASGSQVAYENVVNQHYSPDVIGTARSDLLVGADGDSSITGGDGRDTALGRDGNDTLAGGNDGDFLYGGNGTDTVLGGDGNDVADGGADADSLDGGTGDDLLLGGAGNDTLVDGAGNDTMDGGLDDDTMDGGFGDDVMTGNYGIDHVNGGGGNDQIRGDIGDDQMQAGDGDDTANGGEGADWVTGNAGNDVVYGGFGIDTLNGADGNDTLDGGPDADLVIGDGGLDHLTGGEGADRFDFNRVSDSRAGAEHDLIEDFGIGTGDRFDVAGIDAKSGSGAANDAFTYIGDEAFHGRAGELRYAGGLVQADVNGDGTADFEVEIVGAPALDVDHFIL
ncbi:calcium-binding protein [Azospirillum sp. TSO22-1]|uniref:calcium-binding protein n=1 Tax=Azospirillum sp. TSO22-1 TaxID=716789 RepID=UPI000D64D4EB|nr:calcium-binding protein [Azospirillum sp. TSO22-1]